MKTRILVLGSTGMLGHMVMRVFEKEKACETRGTHLNDKDDPYYFDAEAGLGRLDTIFTENGGYDYLINCIGITKDKIDENNHESVRRAKRVNSLFPHELADFAEKKGARVIHISTDGVFSGSKESYDEDAACDCTDVYGKSKSSGEVRRDNFLNIRCSIMGPSPFEKGGLLEWFLSQPEGSNVQGYTNNIWNGVSTLQFAQLCRRMIKDDLFTALRNESAVFHFAPNQPVSKYELLTLLKSAFNKDVTIIPVENENGAVRRILVSKYKGLKEIYDRDVPMSRVVTQLKEALV